MIAYEILVNGHRVCIAGASGVFDATVCWTPAMGNNPRLTVGGIDKNDFGNWHVDWSAPTVGVGDEVTIRIVSTDSVDPPILKRPA